MAKKCFTPEQIIARLRQAGISASQRRAIGGACRQQGVSEQTYWQWRRNCGRTEVDQLRLGDLELEDGRLEKLVADRALNFAMLEDAARPSL
ncbi:MAG: hypothetical protein C4535_18715 [Comamonadaceae bacterium]|nr:MAG: hypothetical protein C4535_18715 [Comamonadaceae bacterium]